MVIAVVLLLLPVVLIYWWFSRIPEPQVNAVDWQPVVAAAKAESPYPVAVPSAVPEGWTVVRARWTKLGHPGINQQPAIGNTLQLGYLTEQRMYLGLDQRDTDGPGLIRDVTREGISDGESVIADVPWQRYLSRDERTRALVRTGGGSTVVVSGDVSYELLETFAALIG
ncbi:DUF4245 domain-containing protein [Micropruina sp.]|uniref:DUF4245 domain-containing protein n=1 Tax=Micropruina sp. TaxID=2737536 RepID=UPI0039E6DECF